MSPHHTGGSRWGGNVRLIPPAAAVLAALFLALFTAQAQAQTSPSVTYGGPDATVNTDPEIVEVVKAHDAGNRAAWTDLATQAERDRVLTRGLVPETVDSSYEFESFPTCSKSVPCETRTAAETTTETMTDEYGTPDGQPIAADTNTGGQTVQAPAGDTTSQGTLRGVRYKCTHKSLVGLVRWRYWSHWRWRTLGGTVRSASHWEYASDVGIGWKFNGSRYLEPYGRVGTWMVGRRTEGDFTFQAPLGGTVAQSLPKLTVKVYGNGQTWWNCTGTSGWFN